MKKTLLALLLSCCMVFALSPSVLAVRAIPTTAPFPADSAGEISFSNVSGRMRQNNLTILFCRETLDSVNAMDRGQAYDDLQEAINSMNDAAWLMISSSNSMIQSAVAQLGEISEEGTSIQAALVAVGNAAAAKAYYQVQAQSLQSSAEAMESQLKALEAEEYAKTVEDSTRQVTYNMDQLVMAGENLYLSILSTQLQLDSLKQTLASTARTLEELTLRYQLGQISHLTLAQAQSSYATLKNSVDSMSSALSTMDASLQYMLGETVTGALTLTETPTVTDRELNAVSYSADLAAAQKASYTLYSANRAFETAEEDWADAKKEYGSSNYKYQMAAHTYQAAVHTHDAALQNFELSFRSLYNALPTARWTLTSTQGALAYQQQCLAAAQLKFQQGNLSYFALLTAQESVQSAQSDVDGAALDLYSAWHSYRWAVQYGIVNSAT